jgi:hypothetical protein
MEPFRWSARVTRREPVDHGARVPVMADAYVRRHRFSVGAPVQFDAEDSRVSAVEYVIGALGADLVNGFEAMLRERRLRCHAIEAAMSAELENPLTHLGVIGEEGSPRIRRIEAAVYVDSPASDGDLDEAWQESLRRSPLTATLRPSVELVFHLKVSR